MDIRRMNDDRKQIAHRIYDDVSIAPTVLTLCESMMA